MHVITIVLAFAFAIATPLTARPLPQSRLACSLSFNGYYTQGQPIVVRLTLENRSFEPMVIDLGYDREGAFLFKLKRPDGTVVDLPQKKVREGISRIGKFTISSHENYSQQIILDEWYKFNEPGKYSVSLTMPQLLCVGQEFEFEVVPADAEWLSNVCVELVEAIRHNKNDYAKAADAAKVLARIDNPLVVHFLVKALEANRMIDSIVIPAIERIGDKHAVRSLISLLEQQHSTSSAHELVRPALVRLEKRSAPEEVETIRIALARFPIE